MKKNKGITLIALIITIIVMLILVAVSVNILIKSNLIGAAEKATDKYKTALEEETNGETIEIGGKKYNSLEDYLKEKGMIEEVHDWKRTGDNLTCNHCNVTLTIGQELNYTANGTETASITAEKASGYTGEETTAIINNGIKIAALNSNTTLKIASTSAGDSKPTTTQTISKDSNTKWVVLGVEDSNNNGTNDTLLITTKQPTTGKIVLDGAGGYNNAIEEINRMCRELYGTNARGMTIDDVNNCLDYTAPAGMCAKIDSSTNETTNYTLPKGTKISDLGTSYGNIWEDIQNNAYQDENGTKKYFTPSNLEGSTKSSVVGDIEIDGYGYAADSTIGAPEGIPVLPDSTTTATKTVIFGTSNSYRYWLASIGVYVDSFGAYFGPGGVDVGGAGSCNGLFDSRGNSHHAEFPLRAVVPLKSDIPAVVTDSGSEEDI